MLKSEVEVGKRYVVKVGDRLAVVRLTTTHPSGGWFGVNEKTGRQIRIRTAAKLRCEVLSGPQLAAARAAAAAPSIGVNFLTGGGWSPCRRGVRFLFT